MHSWNSLVLGVIWSLIPHVEQPSNKFAKKYLFPICHEKLLEKGPSILYWKTLCPCSFNICREVRTKTCYHIEFGKKDSMTNKSVGWGIIYDLECCQLKPLSAHCWDLTSSWSSFLSSSLNSNKTIVINIGWLSLST